MTHVSSFACVAGIIVAFTAAIWRLNARKMEASGSCAVLTDLGRQMAPTHPVARVAPLARLELPASAARSRGATGPTGSPRSLSNAAQPFEIARTSTARDHGATVSTLLGDPPRVTTAQPFDIAGKSA